MKLYDVLKQNDFADIDIADELYDGLYVAFCFDPEQENSDDPYDKFLTILAKSLNVTFYNDSVITVDATKWINENKTVLEDLFAVDTSLMDDEMTEYLVDTVLPGLISGYTTDSIYRELVSKLTDTKLTEDYADLSAKQIKRNENCAEEIINWLKKNNLDEDVALMYNGKRIEPHTGKEEEIDSTSKYLEKYYNDSTITMTFEGPLYHILNYMTDNFDYCDKKVNEFSDILKKYNYYYEQGHAWNLALYDIN